MLLPGICYFLRLITDLDVANTHLVNLIEGVLRNLSGTIVVSNFIYFLRLPEVIFPQFIIEAAQVVFSKEQQEKGLMWYANYQIKPFYSAAISDTADQFMIQDYHTVVIKSIWI